MKQERYDIHCDSQSALDLSKNAMYHSCTKHIDVRYHWLRQVVEEQQFKLEKIHTDENPADMMTKVVTGGKLQLCAELIGMECNYGSEFCLLISLYIYVSDYSESGQAWWSGLPLNGPGRGTDLRDSRGQGPRAWLWGRTKYLSNYKPQFNRPHKNSFLSYVLMPTLT
ncbi:Unknown protein [Striga hermonthica]|uniref:Uncharacterized protein n=1 Tax=Striga hermonthica TaxID=68872 RepID=A0A9N7NBX8_STRHE|nr:Unknown protein [Striga hermonthica]